ncbi:uncharacterized protein LOC131975958 [Centropristis striata]|uniref:uncharacterized protein LOC131975958 n=1 Tax=Centropristis striata TaxID=184440 RepID=UPI0027DF8313|nr:uncharacterized protein LOC131975958 [Centropristis striata]
MASKTIKKTLVDTFMNLSQQNFEHFCYELLDREEEPRVRRSSVEGRSRLEVADVLVSTFTEAGAVQVAVEILREIDCNEDAELLAARPSAGGRPFDATADNFFLRNRADLIQRVSYILPILEDLLDRRVLNHEEYDHIRAEHTTQDQMRLLIDICRRKGSAVDDIFYRILEIHEPYLIAELEEEHGRKYKKVIDTLGTMAAKRVLFETLNDLSSEELHTFMSLIEAEKGFPVKSRRHLKADIHTIVRLMVETFSLECVELTKHVLKKMNRSDLVQKWLNIILGSKEKRQPPLIHRVETMASVKELLLETLNDLSDEELKTFKEFLEFNVAQKFLPDISSMLRLTVDRAEIVDLMVQAYSRQSVELTREVVEKMNRTDLLQRLSKHSSGLKGPSGNLELEGSGSVMVETMASVVELLLETLAALSDEELKKFKHVLRNHIHSNRRFLDIPLLLLETTDRQDTVFSMVLTWGQQSVEAANEVLKKLERTDLVQRLSDSSMEPNTEHRAALIQRVATVAAVKQLLLETLNDLSDEELEEFKGFLELIVSQKDLPDIFRMLRQTDRADTVDLMVQTYGQLSVDLSMEIFIEMNKIDLMQRLSGLKEKHSVDEHRPALLERAEALAAVKHLILDTLKDLSNDELKEFKWLLQLTYFQKGLPHIQWRRLDCADSAGALVDLMVENQQLMEVTKEVFMDMNRPDLVERLSETSSGLKEKHPSEVLQKEVTMTSTIERLLETFDILNHGELQQFKRLLQHTEMEIDVSKVSRYQLETAEGGEVAELMVETYGQQSVEVTREVLEKMNRSDLVQRFSEISLGSEGSSGSLELEGCGSMTQVSIDWTTLDPEVRSTDEAPTYSLQSEAGNFECSVSGLRWVCKEKVSLKYQFCSLKYHMEKIESIQYMPAGPLMDIKVIAGKLDVVFLPHWICVDDPTLLDKFAVLHIDDCGVTVDKVSEVTSSHVKLCEPTFSLIIALLEWFGILSVEIYCMVVIYYKTETSSLELHVYLIPPDPALIKEIDQTELSEGYKRIRKPHPTMPLKMNGLFILKAQLDKEEIAVEKLRLRHESTEPNYAEVYIENHQERNVELKLTQEKREQPVWTCVIRKGQYQSTSHIEVADTSGLLSTSGSRNTAGPSAGAAEAAGPSAGAAEDEHFVDKHRKILIRRVSNIKAILDDLLDEGVLQHGVYQKIMLIPTDEDKMRELYLGPLKSARKHKDIFLKTLEENEKHLIAELKAKK